MNRSSPLPSVQGSPARARVGRHGNERSSTGYPESKSMHQNAANGMSRAVSTPSLAQIGQRDAGMLGKSQSMFRLDMESVKSFDLPGFTGAKKSLHETRNSPVRFKRKKATF